MQNESNKGQVWVHILLFVIIAAMFGGMIYLFTQILQIKNSENSSVSTQNTNPLTTLNTTNQNAIPTFPQTTSTQSLTPTTPPSPTPVVVTVQKTAAPVATSTQKVTSYVPFSGQFSTTNTDWTNVSGAQAYVDLKNNYSASAYVTFEASIWTTGGGQAFARLFDSTHGIAVDGSEISTMNESSTLVSSGKLNLWAGNNLYIVQIKSLNSSPATFDSGRIKVVY